MSLFWRVKVEVRRQVKARAKQHKRFSFHYDPFSYALNFDNENLVSFLRGYNRMNAHWTFFNIVYIIA
ncbi:hypothetical protein I3843_15G000700 [Carya illinoinensis]|nr:hypothetical protein I3843_15G000700 [Carya illinoinensis]